MRFREYGKKLHVIVTTYDPKRRRGVDLTVAVLPIDAETVPIDLRTRLMESECDELQAELSRRTATRRKERLAAAVARAGEDLALLSEAISTGIPATVPQDVRDAIGPALNRAVRAAATAKLEGAPGRRKAPPRQLLDLAQALIDDHGMTLSQAAEEIGIPRSTLGHHLAKAKKTAAARCERTIDWIHQDEDPQP